MTSYPLVDSFDGKVRNNRMFILNFKINFEITKGLGEMTKPSQISNKTN